MHCELHSAVTIPTATKGGRTKGKASLREEKQMLEDRFLKSNCGQPKSKHLSADRRHAIATVMVNNSPSDLMIALKTLTPGLEAVALQGSQSLWGKRDTPHFLQPCAQKCKHLSTKEDHLLCHTDTSNSVMIQAHDD